MTEEKILQPISQTSPEKYSEVTARDEGALKPTTRRSILPGAASAVAAATVASTTGAVAASLEVQPSSMSMGRTTVPQGYGMPSKYEDHVTRNRTDVYVNKQNYSDWSMTPIQHQQ